MSTSAGQKVNDPNAPPISEGTGIITSDSLAGESLKGDGSFAAGNPKIGLTGQTSAGTTTNTTDISAATTLDPETRDAQQEWSEQAQLNAGIGLGKDAGRGPTWAIPDKSTGPEDASGGPGISDSGSGFVGTAPTAFSADKLHGGEQKPHGKNITEGGIPDNAPNASFNNEIGTDKDPGRVGEQKFQRQTQQSGIDATVPKDKSITGDTPYDVLKETEA
ncbi:hypothetical protein SLS56_004894 [Neofusicoccum ribis]|uniref:Cell surface protein n=1 Tax=Neofusicoccum ribis TaxID=45134 RepID=A0ABR3SV96_9PEZI